VTYTSQCVVLAGFAALSLGMRGAFLSLARERNTDALTGLRNWRSFLEIAEHELNDSSKSGSVVSLGTIEIDNFKQGNDILGHAAGDRLHGRNRDLHASEL
jgi:GGDEF domain-containing protein